MTHIAVILTHLVTALGAATLKATAVLALAALLARLLHRDAAAVRHLIWTVALGSTVALLVLPLVLPAWRAIPVGVVPPPTVTPVVPSSVEPPRQPMATYRRRQQTVVVLLGLWPARSGTVSTTARPAVFPNGVGLPLAVVAIWLAGFVALALRYAWSRMALARLARSSSELAKPDALVDRTLIAMRINRPVSIRMSDGVDLPLTWGVSHPMIVFPACAAEWTPDCWRHVLEHELAHIKRLDAATQLVAQVAQALFWFHPLVWYAVGQMRRERERACDDCVLTSGAVASDYAADLLALVTNHGYANRHTVALAFARRSQFEGRLLALLDPTVDRGVLSSRGIAVTVSLGLALVAPLAAVQRADARPVRQGNTQPAVAPVQKSIAAPSIQAARTSQAPAVVPRPASAQRETPVEPRAEIAVVVDDIFAACVANGRHNESHEDSESSEHGGGDRVWTASGEIGGCRFELKSEGQVSFTLGLTSIAQISPGGYFDAATNIHGDVTRLIATASPSGAPSYELTRNGRRVDFSAAGDAWLEQFLVGLDRITAFAVDQRFPVLLQGGAENVLAEVDRMHTDRAKYVYADRLIQSARLDPAALLHAANIVAGMSTDHSAGELLVGIADRYPLTDPATRTALVGTAVTMTVAHEQARSLLSILSKSTLSTTETFAVLQSLAKMNVDAEKMRVLLAVASSQRLDGDLRNAFSLAAESIRQPQQRARALAALP